MYLCLAQKPTETNNMSWSIKDELEDKLFLPSNAQHIYTDFDGLKIHAIHIPSFEKTSSQNILFLPGALSTAASVAHSLMISASSMPPCNLWVVDLPGFGRSNFGKEDTSMLCMEGTKLLDFYSECIYRFMKKVGISDVIVAGHSFGAFVASYFSSKAVYQQDIHVSKLVLVSPVGLLPAFGSSGYYWACLFKNHLSWAAAPWTLFPWSSRYWKLVLTKETVQKEQSLIGLFIDFQDHGRAAVWNMPLAHLLSKQRNLPVLCICGAMDALVSPDHCKLLGCPSFIVQEAGHTDVLQASGVWNTIVSRTGLRVKAPFIHSDLFPSSYNIYETQKTMDKLSSFICPNKKKGGDDSRAGDSQRVDHAGANDCISFFFQPP